MQSNIQWLDIVGMRNRLTQVISISIWIGFGTLSWRIWSPYAQVWRKWLTVVKETILGTTNCLTYLIIIMLLSDNKLI